MESMLAETHKTIKIRTPDQRLRVFVSSTIKELAPEREVIRRAIEQLHLIPVLFELGARPHSPRELYRAYLSQSHIFLGIYWQSYGWIAPDMAISGLEDEYLLSEKMPRLIYIKHPAPDREQGLTEMLTRIKDESSACFKYFSTPEELRELIANDLVVMLSERFEITMTERQITNRQIGGHQTNLPSELTLFIGREKQITSVSRLLEQEHIRLITFTGPGGVGKTRLALKVASRLLEQFQDGVWLVELATLVDPSLVVHQIADIFGIRESNERLLIQTLLDYLSDKKMLLIIDNCEHLIQNVAQLVETILRGAPQVKVLATSRELLGVAGETIWTVPPLSTPTSQEDVGIDKLTQYEAVNLFLDRVIAVKPDFVMTIQNAAAIAQICAQLDGIPLAIELAAARVRILSVEEISCRLDDRFRLLIGNRTALPRQQTLRALIDWSYDLLSDNERVLFRRLSVFAGGWTLSMVEQVCSGGSIEEGEVLDLLSQLIDKSLVIAEKQESHERYRFLDTIHQFSRQRLSESEEIEEYTHKHAECFLNIAEGAYGELWGSEQDYWLDILGAEHDNLRLALESLTSLTGQEELLLRLAGSLWRFWEIRGYINEGRGWLDRALGVNPGAPAYLRANGLRGAGHLACQQGDYATALEMHEQSLALFSEIDFKPGIARQLEVLGEIAWYQGDYPKALEQHTESLALRYEIKDKEGIAASLGDIGNIARDRGNYLYASELLEESLTLNRELGDQLNIALSLNNLGLVAHLECEYARAKILFEEAVSIYRQLDDRIEISNTLQNLGNVAKDQGNFKQASTLYDECLALMQESGDKRGIAQTVARLAEVAFFQGKYFKASELAERSLSEFRKLGIKRGITRSLQILAFTAHYQGDYDRAISLANESLDLSTEINSPRAIAYAKGVFGLVEYARGNYEAADAQLQETLVIFRKVNDRRNIAHTLVNLARTAYRQGDSARALKFVEESKSISYDLNIQWSLSFSLEIMGLLQRGAGNYEQAFELFQESLRISVEQENQQGIANCLAALAGLASITGQPNRAACLFSAAQRLRQEMGATMGSDDQREYEYFIDILRDQLDEVALEAAWAEGFLMTTERVIAGLKSWSGTTWVEPSLASAER